MSNMFSLAPEELPLANIMVVGVGGAGGNTINTMKDEGIKGVSIVAVNTDLQDLQRSKADTKIQIGREITKGLGAGYDPDKGRRSAEENLKDFEELFKNVDMVFITAGMGGGTGTGASSIIARAAKKAGALTVSVVTLPFFWEGKQRNKIALKGVKEVELASDTILIIKNDNISKLYDNSLPIKKAFTCVDEVLVQATKGVSDLITNEAQINLDFADIKRVMGKGGKVLMGIGYGSGENRITKAINEAINFPLLEDLSISDSQSILVNITGPEENLSQREVEEAMETIHEKIDDDDKDILFGIRYKTNEDDRVEITIIATGIGIKDENTFNKGNNPVILKKEEGNDENSFFNIDNLDKNLTDLNNVNNENDTDEENDDIKVNIKKREAFKKRFRAKKRNPIEDEIFIGDELMEPAYMRRQKN